MHSSLQSEQKLADRHYGNIQNGKKFIIPEIIPIIEAEDLIAEENNGDNLMIVRAEIIENGRKSHASDVKEKGISLQDVVQSRNPRNQTMIPRKKRSPSQLKIANHGEKAKRRPAVPRKVLLKPWKKKYGKKAHG